jgi:hypothetical protein
MQCHPHSYGLRLSAIRATAAGDANVLDDLAIKVVLGLDNAANEHPAVHAGTGAQALKAAELRLYSVVVILGGRVRMGCARLLRVHSEPPSSVGRVPGSGRLPRGHFLI